MDLAGWEERYRSSTNALDDAPTILLVETLARLAGRAGTAIDLACGVGRNALHLAEKGWIVTAVDGSAAAISLVERRAAERDLQVKTKVADLTSANFRLPPDTFDLIVIAFYLQRSLFGAVKAAARPNGLVLAIAHTPEDAGDLSDKRAAAGELRRFFAEWEILHDYEGPSRDPAHRKPVAEIVARKPECGVV
jgi:tellurite methyltransferase